MTDPQTAGMGTTVTAALVDAEAGTVAIGHVGDSRAYLLRGGALEQLTTDHSLVAELVQSGVLTPEEAERHPQRSAITRALGTEATVDVDGFTVETESGDVFLICSDGLSTMLSDDEMAAAIESAGLDPHDAADELVKAANERGGEDNITVVLFEVVGNGGDAAAAPHSALDEDAERIGDQGPDTEEHPPALAESGDETGEASEDARATLRRHGAGPGGRVAALVLIAVILGVGVLALYMALRR